MLLALSGQTLASLAAALDDDAAATDGRHAAAEAMAALADQFAGLVRTLHGFTPSEFRPGVYGLEGVKSTHSVI